MYKKLTVTMLLYQFVLTLLGQLLYLHYIVEAEEAVFAAAAQRYFDGKGEAPVFCEDDGLFFTLRAQVRVGDRHFFVAGKSPALAARGEGILPLFSVWMALSLLSACLLAGGVADSLKRPLLALREGIASWDGETKMPEIAIYCEDELGKTGKSIAASLGDAEKRKRMRLGRMRHELLNPLAALRGAAESIWEETGSPLAGVLMEESDRMQGLLLAGTGSREESAEKTCDLLSLCAAARALCCGMAKKEGRETVCVTKTAVGRGRGDAKAWRAAILNLQQNALRHSPRDSKTVFMTLEKRGFCLFLFFNRIGEGGKGEGRGLLTVKKICRENGGKFWCGRLKKGGYAALLAIPVL